MIIRSTKKYIAKRLENLNQLLSTPIPKSSIDTLHEIRIEIKKLYAVKRFLENYHIKFLNKRTSSELDELFSKSGKIREIQVALELLQTKFPEEKRPI
jgi:CHAD domain-containing protein